MLSAAALLLGGVWQAKGDVINAGTDYEATVPGTARYDFGGSIGVVQLSGNPFGPGNTDTIIQRTSDIVVNDPAGGSVQILSLSLESTAPVNVGGSFFDVFITLDPNHLADNVGNLVIHSDHTLTLTSLTAYFVADFVDSSGNIQSQFFSSVDFSGSSGTWSSTDSQAVPPAANNGFFPTVVLNSIGGTSSDGHTIEPASVPEPAAFTLLGIGIASMAGYGWRRRKLAAA